MILRSALDVQISCERVLSAHKEQFRRVPWNWAAIGQRWTPSFGQVFVTAKVESGVMIQATLG